MADASFHTVALKSWLQRLRDGDLSARDELLDACSRRLEALARKMLRGFPKVKRWEDTGDVFQEAVLKLLKMLEKKPVPDTRGFFNLATTIMRNHLIDRARHYNREYGLGANHDSRDPAAAPSPVDALDRWTAFHEAVERLPQAELEVVNLRYYHDWSEQQIAEFLGVDGRTVRRRWKRAVELLKADLGTHFPGG